MLPGTQDQELPHKPRNIDEDKEVRRIWRRGASRVKEHNRKALAERIRYARILRIAGQLVDDTIYFPMQCDFRGRVYPLPAFLNPQGDDIQKALLTFAQAEPLGEHGMFHLALHGAGVLDSYGGIKFSTLTLDERVAWIEAHRVMLASIAEDPFGDKRWHEAENPFQFYAFCVEYTRLDRAITAGGDRTQLTSSLPVSQDGTCNGVQHFSALLRDEVGGGAVNLRAVPRPNDLYLRIANDTQRALEAAAAGTGAALTQDAPPWAARWLASGLVNRKLCKRPTMTFGYGSRKFGFAAQLKEYLQGLDNYAEIKEQFAYVTEEGKHKDGVEPACQYLASVIWDCLKNRVRAAFNGMEWMRECVKLLAKHNLPVEWQVPGTDFPVRQEYWSLRQHRVETILNGAAYRPTYYSETSKVRSEKQANAISPNFIHSLDAAVLMHTVVYGRDSLGITQWGMVHDSFATTPGAASALAYITRAAFVEYYEQHDPIAALQETLQKACPQEVIPPAPPRGNLDIREVLHSLYFFS
jgi:DNA-directed RNA polymerase